jgi:hypothetical protein
MLSALAFEVKAENKLANRQLILNGTADYFRRCYQTVCLATCLGCGRRFCVRLRGSRHQENGVATRAISEMGILPDADCSCGNLM